MKLLVVGSRSIDDFDIEPFVPDNVDTIISGGAEGVDGIAERFADKYRLSKYIMRPRYHIYGRAAPLKRNEQMVDFADAVLVIWDGKSRGTQYTIRYAEKKKKTLKIIKV